MSGLEHIMYFSLFPTYHFLFCTYRMVGGRAQYFKSLLMRYPHLFVCLVSSFSEPLSDSQPLA